MTLSELADFTQAISAGLTAIGLMLLAYQIYLQRREQRNQEITRLFEEMVTHEFRQKMFFVYSRKPEDLILSKLDESQQLIVTEVSARFEQLGTKVRMGVVPKRETIEIFYDWVIPCAQHLRLYIQDQRKRRGPSYKYREQFDWLAKECKLFVLKRDGYKSVSNKMTLDELLAIDPMPIVRTEKPTA